MKNMLLLFTVSDEMETLLGNEEATFQLCVFVKNLRSNDISKTGSYSRHMDRIDLVFLHSCSDRREGYIV